MEFSHFFVMSILIGLVVFGLVTFSITLSNENNAETNINQNPIINKMFGNVSKELNQSKANAESAQQSLIEEEKNPIIGTLGFVFKSILSATNTFMSMGINTFKYLFIFAQETFSLSPVITGGLLAIIIGLLVLAVWSVVRAGR